jgi:uncharacterized membrane protein YkvA (DUF1232 family)
METRPPIAKPRSPRSDPEGEAGLAHRVSTLIQQALVVWLAARDSRTPLLVRLLALLVAAYAFSPIDLIPDFIPVVGYLDDLLLLPLGIALILKLTPPEVIESARAGAAAMTGSPTSWTAAVVIVMVWIAATWIVGSWLWALFQSTAGL